jgi:hypothetical protein
MRIRTNTLKKLATKFVFASIFINAHGVDKRAVGDLQINATAATLFDSNIYFNENEIDDIIFQFRPTATYTKRLGPIVASATGGGDFGRYVENGQEDYSNPVTRFNIGMAEDFGLFSVDKRTAGKISFGFDTDISQRTEANEQLRDLVNYTLYTANFNIRYNHSPKFGISTDLGYDFRDYQSASTLGNFFTDIETQNIGVNLFYIYSPKLDFFINYTHSQVDGRGDRDFYIDNEVSTVRIGAEGTFTPKISGNASIGYAFRTFDNSIVNSEEGLVFDSGVNWQFRQKTGLSLNLRRNFTTTAQDNALETTTYNLSLIHRFTQRTTGTLAYTFSDNDFQTYLINPDTVPDQFAESNLTGRTDNIHTISLMVDTQLSKNIRGVSRYSYTDFESGLGDIFSNERHLLSFSATLSY